VALVDADRALSASQDKSLKLWRYASPPSARGRAAHQGAVVDLAVAGAGEAVTAGEDGALKLWQLAAGRSLRSLYGHRGEVRAVAVTGDRARAVSAGADGTLRVWSLASGECAKVVADAGDASALRLIDDRRALVADRGGAVRVFDVDAGAVVASLAGHQGPVWAMAVDAVGGQAATGGADAVIQLWDLERGAMVRSLRGHSWDVQALAFHPDGRRLVSASRDRSIKVWDLRTGRCLATLARHSGASRALAVDPAGRVLSVVDDKTLELWSPDDERVVARWSADAGITAIAIDADGRVVLGDVAGRTTYLALIEP
jgi:WD40 repeat protein